ncbi:hypothetical protein EMM73_11925 [Rheinheimera sediminis]|uniref:hypothetical protein n=1 Tax=Rheinheimera sp. YQF-1 TaxID=2499626 RepID=UPI000FD8C3ED|nr:hypothetical protein [Rheinheimera sp. YQF-1]RVT45669.1 hypothetical protein EMM73_11925 [Rheinheimera sp. YQF-1]
MKYIILTLALFSFFSTAKPITAVGDTEVLCAKNYGKEGFYLVTKTAGVSRITFHSLTRGEVIKDLPFEVKHCVLDSAEPLALLTDESQDIHFFKKLDSAFLFERAFSAQVASHSNTVSFYRKVEGDEDNLLVFVIDMNTGTVLSKNQVQKALLRHAALNFSESGKEIIISYMDGAGGLLSYDTESFNVQNTFEDGRRMANQVIVSGNSFIINFDGKINAYQAQTNVWSYSNADLEISVMEKSPDGNTLLLTNNVRAEFAILNSEGKEVVNGAYEQLTKVKFFAELSQSYHVEAVLNDGFALRDSDRKTIRFYNVEQELVKAVKVLEDDVVYYPATTTDPLYLLTTLEGKKVITRL